jgi:hypothetical protein
MSVHTEGMTATDHREAAKSRYRQEQESWERSDTDGFLSQWASNLTAREHQAWADLLDNGGKTRLRVLMNLDGTVASTHIHHGQWGASWVLNDAAAARYGKRFFKESEAASAKRRRATHASKGFTLGTVLVDGYVAIQGSGTGMSGAASCYVATLADLDKVKAGDYEIVVADNYDDAESWDAKDN